MINDGGPAFPVFPGSYVTWFRPEDVWGSEESKTIAATGMSIRQWYAGVAMQGVLARGTYMWSCEQITKDAVQLADALIAVLCEKGVS